MEGWTSRQWALVRRTQSSTSCTRDFGPDVAAHAMTRLSRLCARWLGDQGFSVGISDVTPPEMLVKAKSDMVGNVFKQCADFVEESKAGRLKRRPGLDDAGTLEQEQVKVLSTVRTNIAGVLTSQLSRNNTPMVMANSGSKGSNINVGTNGSASRSAGH